MAIASAMKESVAATSRAAIGVRVRIICGSSDCVAPGLQQSPHANNARCLHVCEGRTKSGLNRPQSVPMERTVSRSPHALPVTRCTNVLERLVRAPARSTTALTRSWDGGQAPHSLGAVRRRSFMPASCRNTDQGVVLDHSGRRLANLLGVPPTPRRFPRTRDRVKGHSLFHASHTRTTPANARPRERTRAVLAALPLMPDWGSAVGGATVVQPTRTQRRAGEVIRPGNPMDSTVCMDHALDRGCREAHEAVARLGLNGAPDSAYLADEHYLFFRAFHSSCVMR
jgi:hypothetical protein